MIKANLNLITLCCRCCSTVLVIRPDNSSTLNRTSTTVVAKNVGRKPTTQRRSEQINESHLSCCHFEAMPCNAQYSEVIIDMKNTKSNGNNLKTEITLIPKCLSIPLSLASLSASHDNLVDNENSAVITPRSPTTLPSSCSLKQLRHHSKSRHPNFPHRHHPHHHHLHHHLLKPTVAGANNVNNALTVSNLDQGVIC